jgi:glutamine amidotransferase
MIAVVNSKVANLRSVMNTLKFLKIEARVAYTPQDLDGADRIILPGVGAFSAGMDGLRTCGFVEVLRERAAHGTPVLGICLGMQLLFEASEEMGDWEGLGILPGRIVRFPVGGPKVPQIGWNQLEVKRDSPLLQGIRSGGYAYFVHSYYAALSEPGTLLASADYGIDFPAIVGHGSVFGAQFHPEKSQGVGLRLLKNFAEMPL